MYRSLVVYLHVFCSFKVLSLCERERMGRELGWGVTRNSSKIGSFNSWNFLPTFQCQYVDVVTVWNYSDIHLYISLSAVIILKVNRSLRSRVLHKVMFTNRTKVLFVSFGSSYLSGLSDTSRHGCHFYIGIIILQVFLIFKSISFFSLMSGCIFFSFSQQTSLLFLSVQVHGA